MSSLTRGALVLALLSWAVAAAAQLDETVMSGATCQSRNLTLRKRSPSDGRIVLQFNGNAGEIPRGLPRASFRRVAQANGHFGGAAATDLEAIGVVCSATQRYDELIAFLRETSGGAGSATITPQAGGSVTLDDGTSLTVPAGAVAAPVDVTIESRGTLDPLDAGGVASVTLQPEGVTFTVPASLTIPYVLDPASDDAQVQAVLSSSAHGPDGEGSVTRPAAVMAVDGEANRITVSLDHFSVLSLFLPQEVVLVPHLPSRFLRAGDLLFLTSGGRWMPGHVGLFGDAFAPATTLAQASVVESTPFISQPPACGPLGQGVVERGLFASFLAPGSVFMGARRPVLTPLGAARRTAILGYARSQIGKCYLPVGLPDPSPNNDFFSCSELAVTAHTSAGVQDFVPLLRQPLIAPYALFETTAPVSDLSMAAGETVQVPIVAATRVGAPGADRYEPNPPGSAVTLSGPAFGRLDAGTHVLTVAPAAADACSVHPFTLTAIGPRGGTDRLTLNVAVSRFDFSNQRPGGTTIDRRPAIGVSAASGCGVPLVSGTLFLDGTAVDSFTQAPGGASSHTFLFRPPSDLSLGAHSVAVEVRDEQGNAGSTTFAFTVQGLPNGWVELGPYGFSAMNPEGPVCLGYRVFGNVVVQGTPYYLCISLVRYGGPHNAGVGVTLGRNLMTHPANETAQCFDTNTPLLLSAFGQPLLSPPPDRWYQLQPWGIDAAWWSDPPAVDVTFPAMNLTIPVSCSY